MKEREKTLNYFYVSLYDNCIGKNFHMSYFTTSCNRIFIFIYLFLFLSPNFIFSILHNSHRDFYLQTASYNRKKDCHFCSLLKVANQKTQYKGTGIYVYLFPSIHVSYMNRYQFINVHTYSLF